MPGFDAAFGVHADALLVRAQRAAVIASNLANADTPHYKARDIDFQAALAGAGQAGAMQRTRGMHMDGHDTLPGGAPMMYRVPNAPSIDQNTVDTQLEHSAFTENTLMYQASLRFLTGRISGIMTALRGE
ncbi:MAG: flagellar basal body rod protein FlgB [Gammaproteobacteria bacterium]|nr:flagellar basal body rod protein FlgB [Gammaproteobacteria bacterium]